MSGHSGYLIYGKSCANAANRCSMEDIEREDQEWRMYLAPMLVNTTGENCDDLKTDSNFDTHALSFEARGCTWLIFQHI